MGIKLRDLLSTKGFVVIIIIAIFYLIFSIYSDLDKIKDNFETINFAYAPIILSSVLFSIFLKSIRQKILLKQINLDLTIKQSFIIFTGGLSLLFTPGASGMLIKSFFLKNKFNAPISKTVPIILMERYLDVVGIMSIISICWIFYPIESLKIPIMLLNLTLIFLLVLFRNQKLFSLFMIIFNKILKNKTELINDTTHSIRNFSNYKLAYLTPLSIVCWIFDAVAFYFCFLSFDISFNILQTSIISFFSLVFGFITLIPGGIGVTEMSMLGLLINEGVEISLGSSMILFLRMTTIWFGVILGLITVKAAFTNKN